MHLRRRVSRVRAPGGARREYWSCAYGAGLVLLFCCAEIAVFKPFPHARCIATYLYLNDDRRSEKEFESLITEFDYLLERYSVFQQIFLLNLCAIDVVIYPCWDYCLLCFVRALHDCTEPFTVFLIQISNWSLRQWFVISDREYEWMIDSEFSLPCWRCLDNIFYWTNWSTQRKHRFSVMRQVVLVIADSLIEGLVTYSPHFHFVKKWGLLVRQPWWAEHSQAIPACPAVFPF